MVTKITEVAKFRADVRRLYAHGVSYAEMGRHFGMHRQQVRMWVAGDGLGPTPVFLRFLRPAINELLVKYGLEPQE